ncbi:thioredoxin family protein [Halarcobacter sp.]|uniref:thioredoxin family protein n=1 Tax=Halarcobacter sp. TaxID=2321133 RepID=UPI0029F4A2CA|nr:thioredoxin family protein [Halarcobacter sp.]
MKKFLLVILVLFSSLYAVSTDLGYETSYSKALIKAKKENKNIMMFVVQKSCPWCRKMEKQTLKKQNIDSLVKRDFVPLIVDEASNNYPSKFKANLFPTTYFISKDKEEIISKVLGYKNKKEFYYILKEANGK